MWAVELDSCYVPNGDWFFSGNILNIKKDNTCELPYIRHQRFDQSYGAWELVGDKKVSDSILFDVPDSPLRGQYNITFYKDYDEMKFKMKLENDSTLLICSKSVISFSMNAKELLDKY